MILCGERVNAATAEKIGLVEQVVAKGEALNTALALAQGVAKQSPTSVAVCKRLVQVARHKTVGRGFAIRTGMVCRFV